MTVNLDSFIPNDLDAEINKVRDHLQIALYQIERKFDLDHHLEKIRKEISKGNITSESLESEYDFGLFNTRGVANYKVALRFSSIYIELAMLAKAQEKISTAWYFVCKANYQAGIMRGALTKYMTLDANDIRKEAPQKGGKNRGAKYDGDKADVIRLIKDLAPGGGWKTPTICFETIREKLIESINARKKANFAVRPKLDPSEPDKFRKLVISWIRYDKRKEQNSKPQSEIYDAYEKHSTFRSDHSDTPL